MRVATLIWRGLQLGAFSFLWALVSLTACADEVLTDIVFLIDVSGSMQQVQVGPGRTVPFQQVIEKLQAFVDGGLPPNSNVTLITFGDDVRQVEQVQVKDADGRKRLQKAFGALRPDANRTYTTKGVWHGLWELVRLKKEFPTHYRLLFLISDGKPNPPQGTEPPITFQQLRQGIQEQCKLKPGDDFYLWYAHFGESDTDVQTLTRDWQGEAKPFTEDWRIGRFNFDRRVIRLAEQLPGDWVAEFPAKADVERGESLVVEGYNVDGKELQFGPVSVPGLPAEAKLTISPAKLKLSDKYQQVTLRVQGTKIPPGNYSGRVQLKPPPGFIIPSPQFFHLDFRVTQPIISAEAGEKLHFGAVTPAAPAQLKLVLKPNPAAAALKPSVRAIIEMAQSPIGLSIEANPASAVLSDRATISLQATILPKHDIQPGPFTGKLLLKADSPWVRLEPAEVPIGIDVKPWTIALSQSEFRVEPGEDGVFEIDLAARREGLPAGAEARFSLGAPKPAANDGTVSPQLEFRPGAPSFRQQQPIVKLSGKIATRQPGKWSYDVPLQSDDPLLLIEPPQIRVVASVARAEVDVVPTGAVDFGNVRPGGEAVREILLIPNEAARAMGPTVTLSTADVLPDGANLKIEPATVLLKEKTNVRLTLQLPHTHAGELQGSIALTSDKAANLASTRLAWRAKAAQMIVNVAPESLDFGVMKQRSRQTKSFWLTPNEVASSAKATVKFAVNGLTKGVSAEVDPPQAELNGRVEVKVTLSTSPDAAEGKPRDARIDLALLPAAIQTSSASVALHYSLPADTIHVDTESLQFENVPPGDSNCNQELRIVGGEDVMGKTVVADLQWTDALPAPMKISTPSKNFTLTKASESVPVVFNVTDAVAGTYHGLIKFSSRDAVVVPSQIPVTVVVGEAAVVVHAESLRLASWNYDQDYHWPLTIDANKFADGATLRLEVAGDLPDITIALSKPDLKLVKGTNVAELVLSAREQRRPPAGVYRGTLTVRTSQADLIVENGSIPIELVVPRFTPFEWGVAVSGGLLLLVAIAGCWQYWPRSLVGTLRVESLGDTEVCDETASFHVDDLISLEGEGRRSVWIGAESGCRIRMKRTSQDSGYYAKIGRRRGTYIRRPRHGSRPVTVILSEGSESNLQPGQSCLLAYGDKIRIQSVTLVYED